MPRIIRELDLSQGHCWNPTIPEIIINPNVFSEGRRIVGVGDTYNSIFHLGCTLPPTTHPINVVIGSPNVFIQNRPMLRDGDLLSCGDVANALEGTVFANGGGLGGPAAVGDPGQTTGYTIQGAPVLEYPTNVIVMYGYLDRATLEFRPCPRQDYIELIPEVYTPIREEVTGQIFKNYPGPPVTQIRGANLPAYAPDSARNPIPINNFRIIQGELPYGVTLSPESGKITGIPTWRYSETITIQCDNDFEDNIHSSNIINITVIERIVPNQASCP